MSDQATQDSIDPDRWFVNLRPIPEAEFRLFFFPFAGGGPSAFTTLIDDLPHVIESRIAHYPGRGSRYNEPALTDIASLTGHLAEAIQPLTDKRFAFFGHSMGAWVAFELARRLRQKNLPQPVTLFASACAAPQRPANPRPIHALPEPEFIKAVIDMNGVPLGLKNQPGALQFLVPMLRADFEAVESYRYDPNPPPLDCPILALGGLTDPDVDRAGLEDWAQHTRSRFEVRQFRGDHFFLHSQKESVTSFVAKEVMAFLAGSHA